MKSAEKVKLLCFEKAGSTSHLKTKFYVIHLRGGDRPCVREKMSPAKVLEKIISFIFRNHSRVVYLMTDLDTQSAYVKETKNYFGANLCLAEDIELFRKYFFTKQPQAIYITELALMRIADGHIETYQSHLEFQENNRLGYLVESKKYLKSCPIQNYTLAE